MLQSLKDKLERDLEGAGRVEAFSTRFRRAEGRPFLRRAWIFRRMHGQFGWKFWAFISGGAALDQDTEEFWSRLGFAVIQGYGLTETTSLVSVNHPFHLGKGSIGKILPGREVKLAEDGEILVRGGGVAAGYWRGNPSGPSGPVTSVTDDEGWYRTGDLGGLDAEGNLYFKGRKKDVLVTPAGMNVYPEDLEAALRAQPEIRDCVVVGVARGGNEEPCAVLILRDDKDDATAAVRRANQRLAEYQRMREWFVWRERDFPRTSTGKPRLNVIRESLPAPRKAPVAVAGASPLADLIGKISGRGFPVLKQESNLEDDLHLNSLERVELMSALEDRYQVDLSETSFSEARTVGDLEQILNGKGAERVEYHYPHWTLSWPVRWVRALAYYTLMRPAIVLLAWPRIVGRENLKDISGPVLVVCNHIDDADVGFVQTALPPRIRHWLATATGGEALEALRTPKLERVFFARRLQWASGVALLNLFPLPRAAAFLKSFAYAGECVDRGYSILVFPEGHHTTDGQMRPFRAGVGLLATRLGVPVVPMRIDGLFEVKRAGRRIAVPGEICVRIAEPVRYSATEDPQRIAADLERRVKALASA
jgi:long-chain acyl-CoA synthetase